jgi:hypothetical protein
MNYDIAIVHWQKLIERIVKCNVDAFLFQNITIAELECVSVVVEASSSRQKLFICDNFLYQNKQKL